MQQTSDMPMSHDFDWQSARATTTSELWWDRVEGGYKAILNAESLPALDRPHFLASPIAEATRSTTEHLQILVVSSSLDDAAPWDTIQQLLTFLYVQATKVAQDMNRILLKVDVLLCDDTLPVSIRRPDTVFRIEGGLCVPRFTNPSLIATRHESYS